MEFLKKHWIKLTVGALLLVMACLMFFSALGDSMIVDEDAHIPAGFSYLTTGDYRLNPEHPPLIKDLAAVPLVMTGMKFPYEIWKANAPVINNQWEIGWKFIYEWGNDADTMIMLARIPVMMIALVFGYFVFRWAKELYGTKAGIFALVLFVFNTNIIAHSRYVTTDLGISAAFFINLYFVYKYLKEPAKKSLLWAGVTFGVVLITKFSAAVLVPTYGIVWLLLALKKGEKENTTLLEGINDKKTVKRLWSGFVGFALIALMGVILMWLFYVPHTINMPAEVQKDLIIESDVGFVEKPLQVLSENPITKPLAQWILGFSMVTAHVEGGHDAFLLGQVSNHGWWYYYPVTVALKTQIAIFVLIILMFAYWKRLEKKDWFTEVYLWILPVVLLLMGMQGKIDLGIRYMLPIYAFIFVSLSKLAEGIDFKGILNYIAPKKGKAKGRINNAVLTVLVLASMIWYVASGILAYPYYLSYFNEFVGGYKNGNKYLTDSNLDWGQDNKRLAEWVKENDITTIYVDVFPGPMPAKYYLKDRMVEWHVQYGRPQGYLAVSATFLRSSVAWKDANNGMDYSWLFDKKPIKNIGGSILIYDLR